MFNLPVPTDSLYKFSFMFGLLLIIFAIYFNDKQFNQFQDGSSSRIYIENQQTLSAAIFHKTQDSIDLTNLKRKYIALEKNMVSSVFTKRFATEISDFLSRRDFNKGDREVMIIQAHLADTSKNSKDVYELLDSLKSKLAISNKGLIEESNKILSASRDNRRADKINFYLLISGGTILFILGALGWYYKIQKLQDELLELQLEEAKSKNTEKRGLEYRKHYEPLSIPKRRVGNR